VTAGSNPVEHLGQLVDYFRQGETPRAQWRVGTEHEKIGIFRDSGARVPYEGERGIGVVLERIANRDGWERIEEAGLTIGLGKDGASISLEPGGQLELSGAPLATCVETCREFSRHVELVKRESADLGIDWLALGIDPIHKTSEIPRMPKSRYRVMRDYLPQRGDRALDMMHATATVQANFDFSDEADMAKKLRMAMACTPITSAMFANASISRGKPNGFASERVQIWRSVDPDRCGILPFVFAADFGYEQYAEWALDVPMFFAVRNAAYHPADGMTFRQFFEKGFEGFRPTLDDWNLHLTTVFPEIRLKQFIEVRGTDCVAPDLICALPALWKGLFYDDQACATAWELAGAWKQEDFEACLSSAARRGLGGSVAGRPMLTWARELLEIAREGLARMAEEGFADERSFLEPIDALLEQGKSPGEVILERWQGEWAGSIDRLIDFARY